MKLLLIEDDSSIRNVLRMSLEAQSFAVDEAEDGEIGSYLGRINEYDIIILDNVLPKKQGALVCKEIRDAGKHVPILMLSAKGDVLEKIKLLDTGADDYLTKPFSYSELLARIKSLLRRPKKLEEKIMKVGNLVINFERQKVTKNNREVYLTRKEFSLLEFLVKNKDFIVSRGQIMEYVWDISADPFSNTIEAHILNIRRKIGDKKKEFIQNIPGRGYRIKII